MSASRGFLAALALLPRLAQSSPDGTCPGDVTPKSLSRTPWRLERPCDDPSRITLSVRTDAGILLAAELAALPADALAGSIALRVNRAEATDGGGLALGWSETHTWPTVGPCASSVSLEAKVVCPSPTNQCALTVSRARGASTCGAACVHAPLSAGQSWVETITTEEKYRSDDGSDYEGLNRNSHLRTLKIVLGAADGGLSLASFPLGVTALLWPPGSQSAYPAFNPEVPLWPSKPDGGWVFEGIVNGGLLRLVSRMATRHPLGPAHVFEVADETGDSSASCGGLATTTSERVEGTITMLDDTLMIVAANLVDDESEVNDRYFREELEDGGVYTATGHSESSIHRSARIDVSCSSTK